MRVGILTLHSGVNYGGTLQCYALFKLLKQMGHNVKVINFIPTENTSIFQKLLFHISSTNLLINDIKKLFKFKNRNSKGHAQPELINIFNKFRRENIELTEVVNEDSIAKLNDDFDLIAVGSDQVWSSFIRSKLTYFGEWSPAYKGRLISVAACATNNDYPTIRRNKIRKLLDRFNSISVRDEKSKLIISRLTSKRVFTVLDPTQLYDFSEFDTLTSPRQRPYILVYVLGEEHPIGNNRIIKFLKEQISNGDLEVIAISNNGRIVDYADKTLTSVNPAEWLSLIQHAEMVFTDSFHASVFSMKYRRKILGYYAEANRSSRLIDLYNRCNMTYALLKVTDSLQKIALNFDAYYKDFVEPDQSESMFFLNESVR